LELRKKRQGRRLKAAAPNKRPNDPIPCIRLLQQNLPQAEVKRHAITCATLNDIVQSLLDAAMARSGASGIAGNKETVRTERGAEAAPQRCRGERASPYS
jgi:hypothetical protein